ncbi:TY-Chap domain-containing protein [Amycolatopsis sp. NPDC098790]|uniref:TY-Chap domain-containing protein n=1 Tax=Amycolatopsis sp. NPDC098790 TaxID=3363939 RepID=UPI003828ECFC
MNPDPRETGRFVRYRDVEYRLRHSAGKWWIAADHAVDESFAKEGRRYFVRPIKHDDVLDCYDVSCPGTYRGLPVEVGQGAPGGYWVTAHDPRAVAEGFERADHRGPLQKHVVFGDPELRFTTTVTPVSMPWKVAYDWEQFTERLTDTFRDVTDGVVLIVHAAADPRRYVQFAGSPDRLYAEAPGTDVVADADEFQLRRFDWVAPDAGQPNWTSSLRRPALTAEFAQLARRCVAALRQAYGIVGPDELRYRAWRQPQGAEATAVELPGLGLG